LPSHLQRTLLRHRRRADLISDIEPDQTVDRIVEQEEFRKMLLFEDERRLLVIGDSPGTGKSALLQKLRYNCQWEEDVPVSLVLLEENPDMPSRSTVTSEIEFVDWLRSDLADHLSFPHFDFLNELRVNFQWPPIAQSLDSVSERLEGYAAQAQMTVGSVQGGVVAGVYIKELNVQPRTAWPRPEQERMASQKCLEAFLLDIRQIAASQPVVLLIDSYERRQPGLRQWIVNGLIRPLLLRPGGQPRADRLVVVLAGHEDQLPPFRQMLQADFDRLVASRKLLGWEKDHVRQFLDVHRLPVNDSDFEIVYSKVQQGSSIRDALRLAALLRQIASSAS
jgi:hypothetical protein